ncbi:MAG TPA: nucleotidyltransferase domain-containing protein [Usitatibacter sp.]|nr:nucleotidyltransferase domain-containing protein [Usitatibacter sp.]
MSLQTSIGAALLGRTREAVIGLLFLDPAIGLHVREIARRTGFSAPTVARELRILEAAGVVTSEAIGRQLSYRANPTCVLYAELKSIALKTWGLRGRVGTSILSLDGIDAAFIFGSFAAGQAHPTSDVDVIVIGSVDYAVLSEAMSRVSTEVGRSVTAKLYRAGEWARKVADDNHFMSAVMAGPKLFLVGDEEVLGGIVESGTARGAKAAEPAPAYSSRGRKPPVHRARVSRRRKPARHV